MNIKKTGFLLGAFAYAAVLFADNTRELKLSSHSLRMHNRN